jgi:hypothetical protein
VQRLLVEVLEKTSKQQKIAVSKEEFHAWLAQKHEDQLEERTRKYLRVLLGQDPPDRDFKRGLAAW